MQHHISPLTWRGKAGGGWAQNDAITFAGGTDGFWWESSVSGDDLYIPIELPYGSIITEIEAEVDPVAIGAGSRLFLQLFVQSNSIHTVGSLGSVATDGTTNLQLITLSGLFVSFEDDAKHFIRIRHALSASLEKVWRVSVKYLACVNAPGPGQSVSTTFAG